METVTPGLKKLSRDGKEFRVGALFNLPKIEELPASFSLGSSFIEYQGNSDMCSGYATCGASGLQEGVRLNGQWSFAVSKSLTNDLSAFGQDLKTACKVHTEYGAIEVTESEVSNPRDIKSYSPTLFETALKHKKQTYLEVASFSDHFDTIKKFIYRFRDEKRAVVIGVQFGWSLKDIYMDTPIFGSGHAMYVIGWDNVNGKDYLLVVNSYGEQAGQKGIHHFSREVINTYVQDYGAFAFVDMLREDVQYALDNNFKIDAPGNVLLITIKAIWDFLKSLITTSQLTIQEKIDIIKTVQDNLPKPEAVVHSKAWRGGSLEERKDMYQLANRVCDEEGLFPSMKRDLLLTCAGESGFNQWCENHNNRNGSVDYGIMQFNSATYLKEFDMTPEEVLNNPEKVFRISARNFKVGRAGNWFAYKAIGETEAQAKLRREKQSPMLTQLAG